MTASRTPGEAGAPRPRPRRLGRPPTLDRDAALRAARDVIGERGFDRTRYADVARRASVPVTTLQHAFGSLQAMLLESVQRSTAGEIPLLREQTGGEFGSPWERLRAFISGSVHSPEDPQSWLVWLELWRLAARDADIGAHAGAVYAQWWDYVAELIALGAESGEFTGPLVANPMEAAQSVVGLVDGLAAAIVMRADHADHARVERLAIDAVAVMLGCAEPTDVAVAREDAPSFAIAVEHSGDASTIAVDGPVPPAEPLSAEGPLPDLQAGAPARAGADET